MFWMLIAILAANCFLMGWHVRGLWERRKSNKGIWLDSLTSPEVLELNRQLERFNIELDRFNSQRALAGPGDLVPIPAAWRGSIREYVRLADHRKSHSPPVLPFPTLIVS